MNKTIALAAVAGALGLSVWLAPWRLLMTQPHDAATAIVMAGGLFTVAIAVLIRD